MLLKICLKCPVLKSCKTLQTLEVLKHVQVTGKICMGHPENQLLSVNIDVTLGHRLAIQIKEQANRYLEEYYLEYLECNNNMALFSCHTNIHFIFLTIMLI